MHEYPRTRTIKCNECGTTIFKALNSQKYCKSCSIKIQKDQTKEWIEKNSEYRRKQYKKTYKPHPKIFKCAKCKKEVKATSVRQKFCKQCSHINLVDYQQKYSKEYRQTKIGKQSYLKLNNKRRAKLNSVTEDFTMEEWFEKIDKTKGICPGYNCEPHFVGKDKLTLDHIIPISKVPKGFIYNIKDVTPLCKRCNTRKRDKTNLKDWDKLK